MSARRHFMGAFSGASILLASGRAKIMRLSGLAAWKAALLGPRSHWTLPARRQL